MHASVRRRLLSLIAATAAVAGLAPSYAAPRQRPELAALPQLVLWAWERPVDLRQLGDDTAVAFLAQTFVIDDARVTFVPRRQPLKVSGRTPLIAVTRIETSPGAVTSLTADQIAALATRIADTASGRGVSAIQIDFDARVSERPVYAALLRQVRSGLDQRIPLTMTALASWCMDDNWLDGLPIDDAVPMLFRMESGPPPMGMRTEPRLRAGMCRGSIGTSLDEPLRFAARGRRVYVFNPNPWSDTSVAEARRLVTQ